jgi:hypothetical protein
LADKINLTVEGGYRFARFRELTPSRDQSPLTLLGGILNRLTTGLGMPISGLLGYLVQLLQPKPVDMDINGCILRAGLKLGI